MQKSLQITLALKCWTLFSAHLAKETNRSTIALKVLSCLVFVLERLNLLYGVRRAELLGNPQPENELRRRGLISEIIFLCCFIVV